MKQNHGQTLFFGLLSGSCSAKLSYTAQTHYLGIVPCAVGWAIPHQSSIISHQSGQPLIDMAAGQPDPGNASPEISSSQVT